MWTVSELKTRALVAFKANYWPCVGAALVSLAVSGGCRFNVDRDDIAGLSGSFDLSSPVLWTVIGIGMLTTLVLAVLLRFLLFNPLSAGCAGFFLRNATSKASFSAIGAPFRDWKRVVKAMFLRDLYLFLWCLPAVIPVVAGIAALTVLAARKSLDPVQVVAISIPISVVGTLLLIPCLVKSYSYRLVPFLLADDPSVSGSDVVTRSRVLMDGHKFHAGILDFSFFGWYLLAFLTCGILAIFFVVPYHAATNAELYRALAAPEPVPPPLPAPADSSDPAVPA